MVASMINIYLKPSRKSKHFSAKISLSACFFCSSSSNQPRNCCCSSCRNTPC